METAGADGPHPAASEGKCMSKMPFLLVLRLRFRRYRIAFRLTVTRA